MLDDAERTELLQMFLADSQDLIDDAEPRLIQLNNLATADEAQLTETVNSVFRLFHSVKGSASMVGLKHLADVTHHAETLLDSLRSGRLKIENEHVSLLLKTIDLLRAMLDSIGVKESDEGFELRQQELIAALQAVYSGNGATSTKRNKTATRARKSSSAKTAVRPIEHAPEIIKLVEQPVATEINSDEKKDLLMKFFVDADEHLSIVENRLLNLEKSPSDPESLAEAYRCIHSIKGNCGFLGLASIEPICHAMESVLDLLRSGEIKCTPQISGALLDATDALRFATGVVVRGESVNVEALKIHMDAMVRIQENRAKSIAVLAPDVPVAPPEVHPEHGTKDESNAATGKHAVTRQDIRVDLSKLDALINLVGELVISETMVSRHPALEGLEDESLDRAIHQLRRVASELQDVAMSVRMVPLTSTFRRVLRIVHDLSAKLSKPIELLLIGEETEVDKTVIEQISDPLLHIVRNSLDHGIELSADRLAAGKSEKGTIRIEARHEGGEVLICIHDDGKGLNKDRILKKAIERGLIDGDGSDLQDRDIYALVFEPGFSTAEVVTDVSGRGVGMDVVRKNIEKLGGLVEIHSKQGEGTTVILRIPLTLAIIDGMLVRVGNTKYTVPLLSIRESFRPLAESINITPEGQEVVRVREELIPIVRLHEVFHKSPDFENLTEGILVIVESGREPMCLFVDEILGQQQTVIKGLSNYLGRVKGVSGCTILGDGQVSLILDITGLISLAERPATMRLSRAG